jgi:ABC-type branched-subunit amino acid transport system ATPase component
MAPAVIEARGLTKHLGELEAVRAVDLEVEAGDVFAFLGPNGAGKSTTISMLCTLIKPTSGTAKVAGFDVVHQQVQPHVVQPDACRAARGSHHFVVRGRPPVAGDCRLQALGLTMR